MQIINSDALEALRTLPDCCCSTCITSPPYYYYDAEAVKEPAVGFYNAAPAGSTGTGKPNARRRGGGIGHSNRSAVWDRIQDQAA